MEFEISSTDVEEARQLATGVVGYWRRVDRRDAIDSAAQSIGVSKWSFWNLLYGQRKTVASRVLSALRREYLRIVELQVHQLEAQLARLKQKGGNDDAVTSIGAEAARLVGRLRQAREHLD